MNAGVMTDGELGDDGGMAIDRSPFLRALVMKIAMYEETNLTLKTFTCKNSQASIRND
jgi:hypothetical protein